MFKYLFVWFLAAYSYDNMLKTYTSYTSENTFGEMKDFIIHQQKGKTHYENNVIYNSILFKTSYFK